jgi:uncharacterized protein YqgQ
LTDNNIKHISKSALIKQIETTQKSLNILFENMKLILDETPLSWADKKAEQAFKILNKKGHFTSMDFVKIGVSERYKKARVFDKLCERYSEVRIRLSKDPRTNREQKIAYIPKEQKSIEFGEEEFENLPKNVQDLEGGDYVRVKNIFKESEKTTKVVLMKKLNLSENAAQSVISQLVSINKIIKDPVEDSFKWVGE